MNRTAFAAGMACMICGTSAFAQSNTSSADLVNSAAISDNFQFMNHPPPPPPAASSPPATGSMGGRGRRQGGTNANSTGNQTTPTGD